MGDEHNLLTELRDGVMVLTINRPEALNAFDMQLLEVFGKSVAEIAFDQKVKVVVITGASGGKKRFQHRGRPEGKGRHVSRSGPLVHPDYPQPLHRG